MPKDSKATTRDDLGGLSVLGSPSKPSKKLEKFPNHHPTRDYFVRLETDEFTCLCPLTGQPDFAKLIVEYIPGNYIVESKSFKFYLQTYRNEGCFHEHVTNIILDDLLKAIEPRYCKVTASFHRRGGIAITVEAKHGEALPKT